ncbi:MAG: glycerol-3-phosphate 1-O-acyltransferase PlsY [Planctomycetes bacterium]|nr:glycerol-3-phosphate 1-O-acyltransferase PlsY [Planctomycetota bacterium]
MPLAIITASELGLAFLAGFLMFFVGSIPFGLLVGFSRGVDVRKAGSGNIGATNVGRTCGRFWGFFTLFLDASKGFLPVFLVWHYHLGQRFIPGVPHPDVVLQVACGIGAITGHMYPIYLRFKGGKGIATAAGVFLAASPWALLCAFTAWVLFTVLTRYVSVGSIASVIALASGQMLTDREAFRDHFGVTLFTIGVMVFSIYKHRGNVKRIYQGTEPKIKLGKKDAAAAGEAPK